ncbi:MAG: hypothetical protein N3I35_04190 [Clostridia bacterium]|nr:hypothetical protein [Clostridia bacterium]
MGEIDRRASKALFCFVAGILTGVVAGAALVITLIGYRVDSYHERIRSLEIVIYEKEVSLKKLNESVNKRKYLLKEIEIILLSEEGDEIDLRFLEKTIKEKYSNLLGKEVRSIDMEMVTEVIDRRLFRINEKLFKLKVNRILLSEEMKIWAQVEVLE